MVRNSVVFRLRSENLLYLPRAGSNLLSSVTMEIDSRTSTPIIPQFSVIADGFKRETELARTFTQTLVSSLSIPVSSPSEIEFYSVPTSTYTPLLTLSTLPFAKGLPDLKTEDLSISAQIAGLEEMSPFSLTSTSDEVQLLELDRSLPSRFLPSSSRQATQRELSRRSSRNGLLNTSRSTQRRSGSRLRRTRSRPSRDKIKCRIRNRFLTLVSIPAFRSCLDNLSGTGEDSPTTTT